MAAQTFITHKSWGIHENKTYTSCYGRWQALRISSLKLRHLLSHSYWIYYHNYIITQAQHYIYKVCGVVQALRMLHNGCDNSLTQALPVDGEHVWPYELYDNSFLHCHLSPEWLDKIAAWSLISAINFHADWLSFQSLLGKILNKIDCCQKSNCSSGWNSCQSAAVATKHLIHMWSLYSQSDYLLCLWLSPLATVGVDPGLSEGGGGGGHDKGEGWYPSSTSFCQQ